MKHELTAKRIQQALSNVNIKPQELADKSGVSKSSISQYVNGSHTPGNISAGKLGIVLDVNPLWLMGFDVPMERQNDAKEESPQILDYYNQLNDTGKQVATDRVKELTEVPRYIKEEIDYSSKRAAHPISDATEEDKEHDMDIMKNF